MSSRIQLAGSERRHPLHSVAVGEINLTEHIQVTLVLRRKSGSAGSDRLGQHRSREAFAGLHGADRKDAQAVIAFASAQALSIVKTNFGARTLAVEGPLSKLVELFGADLRFSRTEGQTCRTRTGHLSLPEELSGLVVAVLGFDERPLAATHRRVNARSATPLSFSPIDIARLYNFPSNTGKGQTIALIELGGRFNGSDLRSYWSKLGLPEVAVTAVGIDEARNAPLNDPDNANGEVGLDIEVAGAIAPGSAIAVYFAANTDEGFLNAINDAIHDAARQPSVISISWGSAESEWTGQSKTVFNAAFQDAALLGISVCVAAGDSGSSDGESDGGKHVDFPASSPWVLACGGTRLIANGDAIESETVWNNGTAGGSTGGGVSSFFIKPAYQAKVKVPKPTGSQNSTGRGVPDVAGVADPETGYRVFIDGQESVIGGTSAVAPLWAALIALCNEQLGKNLGFINPVLYSTNARSALHDITVGANGAFHSTKGWDCCTGLGTPNGAALLKVFKGS